MTATLKGSFEELVEDSLGSLVVNETSRKHDYIGIIVLADKLGDILVPSQARTYTLVLVKSHSHTFTAAADTDTRIDISILNAFCQSMGKIRIVYALVAICAIILNRITLLF